MISIPLRLRHTLTAYHWRYNRGGGNSLAICECGWKDRLFRRTPVEVAKHMWCGIVGHRWDEPEWCDVGMLDEVDGDFEEGEGNYKAEFHQCERCYEVETLTEWIGVADDQQA